MSLTVLYYTANTLREPFASRVREQLIKAIGNLPLVSVSQIPMNFGKNICVGHIGQSYLNIYRQILVGAKASETDFVALAEDDVLYPPEHFTTFLPPKDRVAYDMARWSFYTWSRPPIFTFKNRQTNTSLIAPRELIIEALEERFAKYPDDSQVPLNRWAEVGRKERELGVTVRKVQEFVAQVPHIMFSHEDAIGYQYLGKRKAQGFLKAYDVPYWGKAEAIMDLWRNP
jgi:hypothetical protein